MKDPAPPLAPAVRHLKIPGGGGTVVPLAFPVAWYGQEIRAVRLLPMTLDELEFVGALPSIGPADLLAPMSGFPRALVGALRWPDVEALIVSALDLCPPEVAQAFRGAPEAPEVAAATDPEAHAPEGAQPGPGFALGLDGTVPEVDPSLVHGEAALRDLMTDPSEMEIR
jgi:hypothetical protein